jgi:hypothetical protein
MSEQAKLIGATSVVAGSAAVLAAVRNGPIDVADGAVLILSLGALARAALRSASDPEARRRRGR